MKRSRAMLWSGLALPPLAWFLSLGVSFTLAHLACSARGKGVLHAISGVAFVLALLGGTLSWMERRRWHPSANPIAVAGVVLGVFFALVILAQSIPNLLLAGCE